MPRFDLDLVSQLPLRQAKLFAFLATRNGTAVNPAFYPCSPVDRFFATMQGIERRIAGVSVVFPFKPYASQLAFSSKLLSCLNNEQNGLLESPTGSGKSVALLSSLIAWRHRQQGRLDGEHARQKAERKEALVVEPVAKNKKKVKKLKRELAPRSTLGHAPTPSLLSWLPSLAFV